VKNEISIINYMDEGLGGLYMVTISAFPLKD